MNARFLAALAALALPLLPGLLDAAPAPRTQPTPKSERVRVNPVAESPVLHYAQGGVVKNGIAYFTSDPGGNLPGKPWRDDEFDYVMGFDAKTLTKVRSYDFRNTYDSAPFVFQKKDGTWLITAHEEGNSRTVARRLDNDRIEWIIPANQTVTIYFGVSTYR